MFKIDILSRGYDINPDNDNVDVEVTLNDGEVFSATFFTLNNLRSLMEKYSRNGECANGLYIWAADMIIVTRITEEIINASVKDLIDSGEIFSACSRIR